jgi:hypothetical protein
MPNAELGAALEAIEDEEGVYLWGRSAPAWAAIEEAARRLKAQVLASPAPRDTLAPGDPAP